MPNPVGRPTACTPEIIEKIGKLMMAGHYLETAAPMTGVAVRSARYWLARGRKETDRLDADDTAEPNETERIFVEFLQVIEKATATADFRDLTQIDRASQGAFDLDETVTATRQEPVLDVAGNPIQQPDGTLLYRTITTTTRRTGKISPVWTAAAWRLERRSPERFGRKQLKAVIAASDDAPNELTFRIEDADGTQITDE